MERYYNSPSNGNLGAINLKAVTSKVAAKAKAALKDPEKLKQIKDTAVSVISTYQQSKYGSGTGIINPEILAAKKAQISIMDQMGGRTKFKRRFSGGLLQGVGDSTLLDLFVGTEDKGKPIMTMEHSISNDSIMYMSLGFSLAAIVAGVTINKLS